MNWRVVGALLLAFWPLSVSANADVRQDGNLIQFSYTWGIVEQTYSDTTVSVTVTNNITNKIGYGGEVIDTYRITLGDQVIQVTEKHDALVYTFEIVGTQTLRLEGIDNGYWAGYYGPIMQVSEMSAEPTATESPTVSAQTESATVSESAQTEPTTESSESPSVSESVVVLLPAPEPTQEATPSPEPLPQPIPDPSPIEPSLPQPTPTEEPSPQPTASPVTVSPEPTQSPEPTISAPVLVTQSPEPTQTPTAQPTTTPTALPLPEPSVEPSPVYPTEEPSETPIEPTEEVTQVAEETESESVSGAVETAITEAFGAAVKAVGELVSTVTSAGLDMTPEKREEAQDVVVSAVIVSQVASAASVTARKIK